VVDGIELDMFDQLEKVRKLDRRGTLGFQQQGYAGDEIIEQRDMRQHMLPMIRSACRPLPASSFARRSPKNSTRVGHRSFPPRPRRYRTGRCREPAPPCR